MAAVIVDSSANKTTLSITLLNSLTLPGQRYPRRAEHTSYFAAANSDTSLLHLWSLGVEEQFYIVWPLLLTLAYRQRRARAFFVAMAFFAIVSFLLGEFLFNHDPAFVYYMMPTRAGELLLGALVALTILKGAGQKIPKSAVALWSVIGILMMLGSLFLLSEESVFPGLLAVPPTLGTAIVIFAGHRGDNWISKGSIAGNAEPDCTRRLLCAREQKSERQQPTDPGSRRDEVQHVGRNMDLTPQSRCRAAVARPGQRTQEAHGEGCRDAPLYQTPSPFSAEPQKGGGEKDCQDEACFPVVSKNRTVGQLLLVTSG